MAPTLPPFALPIRRLLGPATVLAALVLGGCASMLYQDGQLMTFNSEPSDARVTIERQEGDLEPIVAKTPASVMVKGAKQTVVRFEKEGYHPRTILLQTEARAASILGNFLLGGLLFGPFSTSSDVESGAYYEYKPNSFLVTLEPVESGPVDRAVVGSYESRLRRYIAASYDAIVTDLARGSGEHADGMILMLALNAEGEKAARKDLAGLAMQGDMVSFANNVVSYHLRHNPVAGAASSAQSSTAPPPMAPAAGPMPAALTMTPGAPPAGPAGEGLTLALFPAYRQDSAAKMRPAADPTTVLPRVLAARAAGGSGYQVRYEQIPNEFLHDFRSRSGSSFFWSKSCFMCGYEPDRTLITRAARELKVDLAFTYSYSYSGTNWPLDLYLIDVASARMIKRRYAVLDASRPLNERELDALWMAMWQQYLKGSSSQ